MAVQTIEEWAARLRIAAAVRDIRESAAKLVDGGRELYAALAEARRLGVAVEPAAELELTEAGR